MKVIWQGKALRGGMAQWALLGALAAVVGLVAFVFVAFGLVVGAVLAGIFSLGAALASRRRAGGTAAHGGREADGNCVELGGDAYTVRIVEEEKPPASAATERSSPGE